MQFLVVAIVAALTVVNVDGDRGFGFDSSEFGLDSSEGNLQRAGSCTCRAGFWRNICTGNVGTVSVGCTNTNKFRQCADAVCSIQTCPTGQVWDNAAKACAACPAGKHIRATDLQLCVCDKGTTLNRLTGLCTACPTGATVLDDSCGCPDGTVLDINTNACRACPAGSTLSGRRNKNSCTCTDIQQFWNAAAWVCQPCPGEWTPKQTRRKQTQVCTCTGANQVFDRSTVSCFTCPAGTTATAFANICRCAITGQWFDKATSACSCPAGTAVNAAGTACTFTQVPPAAPITP
jgi:hypothetical protein